MNNGVQQRAQLTTITNSSQVKGASRSCPTGMTLTDVGGVITDGDGQVALTRLYPDPGLGSATVRAQEVDPYPNDWSLRAYLIRSD